jgi:hypothetical protein
MPLNHNFPALDEMNIRIAKTASPFKPSFRNKDGKRKIMINNFDASVRIITPTPLSIIDLNSFPGWKYLPIDRRCTYSLAKVKTGS